MAVINMIVTLFFIAMSLTFAAPAKIGHDKATTDLADKVRVILEEVCQLQFCLLGKPTYHHDTFTCECPKFEDLFPHPCDNWECTGDEEPFYSFLDDTCFCQSFEEYRREAGLGIEDDDTESDMEHVVDLKPRQASTVPEAPVDTAAPTFIPPPSQDITPALLNESLTIQPQNTATVASIIPYFPDNVLQVHLQLNGPVADTLVLNATTSLPCGDIGLDPEPNLALVPQVAQQGGDANCVCIAVNMYTPNVINYWIQKVDGTVYSLTGSNKVVDLNKMNTNQSVALSLITLPSAAVPGSPDTDVLGEAKFGPGPELVRTGRVLT